MALDLEEKFKKNIKDLKNISGVLDKIHYLTKQPFVNKAFERFPFLKATLDQLKGKRKFALLSLLAIGQAPVVFNRFEGELKLSLDRKNKLNTLIDLLCEVEEFYEPIGGVIGYQLMFLNELEGKKISVENSAHYLHPEGYDISLNSDVEKSTSLRKTILNGIASLDRLAEIYPVGGAGERLGLKDPKTLALLPAAMLMFRGKTLLEMLFRDLFAREYLHFKLYQRQVETPVALMTSFEKDNHHLIVQLIENSNWFGRKKTNFRFFTQPLVPMVDEKGNWIAKEPFVIDVKPGGHGVIWKLARDKGVFKWLKNQQRDKAIVRQINNPAAGVDTGLLAFYGVGIENNKQFGFASCERRLNAPEGMNVLYERKIDGNYAYSITNVEYTDFGKKGVQDLPKAKGSPYSVFPCNTNILFVDIDTVNQLSLHHPAPGLLINLKSETEVLDCQGKKIKIKGGRLETTMQNLADEVVDLFKKPIQSGEQSLLKSYLTFNERKKTLSVTKTPYVPGKPFNGTPEGCDYELLQNDREVLERNCGFILPKAFGEEAYLKNGPEFIFDYHPALGPNFSIIGKKIRGGELKQGAEWRLEIAEVDVENLSLDGSLHIDALNALGSIKRGKIHFDGKEGRCRLKNVRVVNRGIDRTKPVNWWKRDYSHHEMLKIVLEGCSEFEAVDVVIEGDHTYRVPNDHCLRLYMEGEILKQELKKIKKPSWHWHYSASESGEIHLRM